MRAKQGAVRSIAVEEAAGGLHCSSVIGLEVERWRTKARETAEGFLAEETGAAIRQAAKARCRELEAQCEAKCKDTEAAVEARVIAQAQAEFGRVYAELQARCKAESEAAVEARIDEAKAELRLEFGRARAEFEARCKAKGTWIKPEVSTCTCTPPGTSGSLQVRLVPSPAGLV